VTHLMILEPHIPQERVVLFHSLDQILQPRLVLVDFVSGDKTLVELDDLPESEVLPGWAIKPSSCLNELFTRELRSVYSLTRKAREGRTIKVS
jgi:hypothetical protein